MAEPLVIEAPWRQPKTMVAGGLLLLAADIGLVVAVRYVVVVAQSYGLFIPLFLLYAGPLIAYHFSAWQRFRNVTTFSVTGEAIEIAWGPHGPGERRIEIARVRQLFVTGRALGRATLWAWMDDGTIETVARSLPTALARHVEQTIEAHLGIVDQAVKGEAPKGEALRAARRREWWRPAGIALIAIAGGTFAVSMLTRPALGGVVASANVRDGPADVRFALEETARVDTWVRMEIQWDEVLGQTHKMWLDRLPHVFDIHVTIDDREIVCDPFRVEWFETQSNTAGITESSIAWFGRLRGCKTSLSAGSHRGEVYLERLEGSQKVRVDRAEIILRTAD